MCEIGAGLQLMAGVIDRVTDTGLVCAAHGQEFIDRVVGWGLAEQRSPVDVTGRRAWWALTFLDPEPQHPEAWLGIFLTDAPTFEAAVARAAVSGQHPGGQVFGFGFRAVALAVGTPTDVLITDPAFTTGFPAPVGVQHLRPALREIPDSDSDSDENVVILLADAQTLVAADAAGMAEERSVPDETGRRIWWAVSFAGKDGWRDLYHTDAPTVGIALARAAATGCNPGGEVLAIRVLARSMPDGFADQLVTDSATASAMPLPDGLERP